MDEFRPTWLDRVVGFLAPRAGLRRLQARAATDLLIRHYEAASNGRRTAGWRKGGGDPNAVIGGALSRLRDTARDLVRNNGHAESAVATIADHAVGWGITAKPQPYTTRAAVAWKEWAETTACDADGRLDFYGLQKLIMRTIVESGEVLVRKRPRLLTDGLPLPLQLQVLEPDYLDTLKTGIRLPNGGAIVNGIELDPLGRRAAYWLFREHPGTAFGLGGLESVRVPAASVLHVFKQTRAGQMRAPSWFAPVLLHMKDLDDYEDAQLMKQKIAACLAVITTDVDGVGPALGTARPQESGRPELDSLEPGMIHNAPPGRAITVVEPPTVGDYGEHTALTLRKIAAGIGVTFEDLTGDYQGMPYSAARMSRLRHWARVEDWRWQTLIPQFCDPAFAWAMEAASILGVVKAAPKAEWTAPPAPMIEPDKEGLAYMRNIRTGLQSLSDALRERGYDPDVVLEELADDMQRLDDLGLVLDCDPRKTTQAGNPVAAQLGNAAGAAPGGPEPDEDEDDEPAEDDEAEDEDEAEGEGAPA